MDTWLPIFDTSTFALSMFCNNFVFRTCLGYFHRPNEKNIIFTCSRAGVAGWTLRRLSLCRRGTCNGLRLNRVHTDVLFIFQRENTFKQTSLERLQSSSLCVCSSKHPWLTRFCERQGNDFLGRHTLASDGSDGSTRSLEKRQKLLSCEFENTMLLFNTEIAPPPHVEVRLPLAVCAITCLSTKREKKCILEGCDKYDHTHPLQFGGSKTRIPVPSVVRISVPLRESHPHTPSLHAPLASSWLLPRGCWFLQSHLNIRCQQSLHSKRMKRKKTKPKTSWDTFRPSLGWVLTLRDSVPPLERPRPMSNPTDSTLVSTNVWDTFASATLSNWFITEAWTEEDALEFALRENRRVDAFTNFNTMDDVASTSGCADAFNKRRCRGVDWEDMYLQINTKIHKQLLVCTTCSFPYVMVDKAVNVTDAMLERLPLLVAKSAWLSTNCSIHLKWLLAMRMRIQPRFWFVFGFCLPPRHYENIQHKCIRINTLADRHPASTPTQMRCHLLCSKLCRSLFYCLILLQTHAPQLTSSS